MNKRFKIGEIYNEASDRNCTNPFCCTGSCVMACFPLKINPSVSLVAPTDNASFVSILFIPLKSGFKMPYKTGVWIIVIVLISNETRKKEIALK